MKTDFFDDASHNYFFTNKNYLDEIKQNNIFSFFPSSPVLTELFEFIYWFDGELQKIEILNEKISREGIAVKFLLFLENCKSLKNDAELNLTFYKIMEKEEIDETMIYILFCDWITKFFPNKFSLLVFELFTEITKSVSIATHKRIFSSFKNWFYK